MSTTQHISQQDKHNKEVLSEIEQLISHAKMSHEMLKDHKVLDSLGSAVSKFNHDPLAAITETYMDFNEILLRVIKDVVAAGVYSLNETTDLYAQLEGHSNVHFYIVLDDDTFEIRNRYYDLLDEFRSLDFSKKFSLAFHFINPAGIINLKTDSEKLNPLKNQDAN